jgi:hypothetical protein
MAVRLPHNPETDLMVPFARARLSGAVSGGEANLLDFAPKATALGSVARLPRTGPGNESHRLGTRSAPQVGWRRRSRPAPPCSA